MLKKHFFIFCDFQYFSIKRYNRHSRKWRRQKWKFESSEKNEDRKICFVIVVEKSFEKSRQTQEEKMNF